MAVRIDCYGVSDVGNVRKGNEDQFVIADLAKKMSFSHSSLHNENSPQLERVYGKLFVVADGMGGAVAGEQASAIAVETVVEYILRGMQWSLFLDETKDADFQGELKKAILHCQDKIQEATEQFPDLQGMGTTLTMACATWPRLYVVHAGDSRCYLKRKSDLKQITTDHTVVQQLVENGVITEEKAENVQWGNLLWNAIGGNSSELATDICKLELQHGDMILLCSDGLNKHVTDKEINCLMDLNTNAEDICNNLVELAKEEGGTDNITIVVAHFIDEDAENKKYEDMETLIEEPAEKEEKSEKSEKSDDKDLSNKDTERIQSSMDETIVDANIHDLAGENDGEQELS